MKKLLERWMYVRGKRVPYEPGAITRAAQEDRAKDRTPPEEPKREEPGKILVPVIRQGKWIGWTTL